jgi:Trk K+ transport system NAD-binding subunit
MERPIVLCGLGRMGRHVLGYLQAAGLPVVVVDTVAGPDDPILRGTRLVRGDCRRREVLEQAGVADSAGVLIMTNDDLVNVSAALAVRALNPDVRVVLRMFNQNLLGRLGKAVKNVVAISTSELTAPTLAITATTGEELAGFRVNGGDEPRRVVAEVPVGPTSPVRGQRLGSVAESAGAAVVAHLPSAGAPRFLLDVDPETHLAPGDTLVLCGVPRRLAPLLAGGEGAVATLRWAGWVRRMGRVAWRTLLEVDRAVLVCAAVLLVVLVAGTLVLHFSVPKYERRGLPFSLLRTVSILATGASLNEEDFPDSPRVQVFVSVLRIAGAVLLAAFTAIVTNYLLRARLGGAFEVRRIPEEGHLIVCGLSTLGFRVVEELINSAQRVVAIERDPTNRFITTARRLGAAVVVGDAVVAEVLRQAHAPTAQAVIATTNNDMTNLEMALLVREMSPTKRVVLVLNDPRLAEMLRESANVRLAFSVPHLAAPAVLAELLGDRVLTVFLLREHLFAVVNLIVQEQDPLNGQPVRAVAVDYRVQPVAVLRGGAPLGHPLPGVRLAAGDRLVGVIAMADLQPLVRRQAPPAPYGVEVTGFLPPARGWLAGLVRTRAGVGAEDAEKALEALPLRLAGGLTRGQAEDLLAQLARERVSARLCAADGEGM